jgi:DNA-binding Lrp family transcriptional regulator
MDEVDSAIIRALQEDARQPNQDIARKVGIAPSTCLERTRLLRQRGVIRGYHADIDLGALNRVIQALVAAQIRPLSRSVIEAFQSSVAALPEVLAVFTLAGSDDFIIHVAAQDIDHLHAFLIDRVTSRREIVGFRTSIVYRHQVNTVLSRLPPPNRSA